jgi:putative DeoR family transcriptional regulator (stage III sporulation protein D)
MQTGTKERCVLLAEYIVESGDTVRGAAAKFGISKSTVHHDITNRLQQYNRALYMQVRKVLEHNKEERHIRGGNATREKYALIRQNRFDRT